MNPSRSLVEKMDGMPAADQVSYLFMLAALAEGMQDLLPHRLLSLLYNPSAVGFHHNSCVSLESWNCKVGFFLQYEDLRLEACLSKPNSGSTQKGGMH